MEEIQNRLTDAGFRGIVIPIDHLPELKADLEDLRERGRLDPNFYEKRLSYLTCEPPPELPAAKSIVLTAARSPKVIVTFRLSGRVHPVTIPPTYLWHTDFAARDLLERTLERGGYRVYDALLPVKLLAVRCGLAGYGRNNITYIDGWGSYFRLKAFYSDMPCDSDAWHDLAIMEACASCAACVKNCPVNVIRDDRFLVDITRCITYHNEWDDDFPEWMDPSWHNSLVGCMTCQDICPMNRDLIKFTAPGEEFSEDETGRILGGVPLEKLPESTVEKLTRLCIQGYYELLQRNLSALIRL